MRRRARFRLASREHLHYLRDVGGAIARQRTAQDGGGASAPGAVSGVGRAKGGDGVSTYSEMHRAMEQFAREMPSSIAEEVAREGDRLQCQICGREKPLATDDWSVYLAYGWPSCCGQTMRLIRGEATE